MRTGSAVVYNCTLEQAIELVKQPAVEADASYYLHAAQRTKSLADNVQFMLGRGSLRDGIVFGRGRLQLISFAVEPLDLRIEVSSKHVNLLLGLGALLVYVPH